MKMSRFCKKIISIILIIFLIQINSGIVMAGLIDNIKSDSGPAPSTPTPGDDKQTKPYTPPETHQETYHGKPIYTNPIISHEYISGNVYEDLGFNPQEVGKDDDTQRKGIQDVYVICKGRWKNIYQKN